MNERIKELMMNSWNTYFNEEMNGTRFPIVQKFDAEKFARLIVQEFLDIASEVRGEPKTDTHFVIGYNRACEKMIDAIKEHFGVEE